MQILLNGEPKEIPNGMNVAGLLQHLALDDTKIAIEQNRAIVPKSTYGEAPLHDKDEIEIVGFIGGG